MLKALRQNNYGQTMVEYTIIIGLIVIILFAMSPMIKRGTQGMIKLVADQIGNQLNADQTASVETGHLNSSYITTRAATSKTTEEYLGVTKYVYDDSVHTESNALINLGFTEQP